MNVLELKALKMHYVVQLHLLCLVCSFVVPLLLCGCSLVCVFVLVLSLPPSIDMCIYKLYVHEHVCTCMSAYVGMQADIRTYTRMEVRVHLHSCVPLHAFNFSAWVQVSICVCIHMCTFSCGCSRQRFVTGFAVVQVSAYMRTWGAEREREGTRFFI